MFKNETHFMIKFDWHIHLKMFINQDIENAYFHVFNKTFSYEFNSDEFEHCKHKLVIKRMGHLFDHCKTCSLLLNEYYEKLFVLEG